ncbi:MAG: hypothetical protein ACI9ZV_000115 [Candidatus Azotimanducaceae bacterium]|jgi:hypothetical protein
MLEIEPGSKGISIEPFIPLDRRGKSEYIFGRNSQFEVTGFKDFVSRGGRTVKGITVKHIY